MALDAVAAAQIDPTPDHPDVAGAVVDIPADGGTATVVSLSDNTTSMYTSTGGGTIGAGEHPPVAAATHRLLSVVQAHLGLFTEDDGDDLPTAGTVRFHVLTPAGRRRADAPEEAFWGRGEHELMPVIVAAQEVISAIRSASPSG